MKKTLIIVFGLCSLFVFGQCPVIITDAQVACEGYTWSDGNSYNSQNYLPITTIGEQTLHYFQQHQMKLGQMYLPLVLLGTETTESPKRL